VADRTIRAVFVGDASSLLRANQQVEASLSGLGGKVEGFATKYRTQIGIATAAGGAAIIGFAAKGVQAASDLEESQNRVNQVFQESADVVRDYAGDSSRNLLIAEADALQYAGALGAIFNASKLTRQESAEMSVRMVELAQDMSSAANIPLDEALEKIRSGLVGEAEPLRTVGVLLSAAEVEAKAYALGLAEVGEELTEAQKVQARYAIILEQTSDMHGDAANTAGSFANQTRALDKRMTELSATVGVLILPLVSGFLSLMLEVPGPVLAVGAVVVVLGTALGAVLLVLPPLIAGWTTLIALGPVLGAAMTAATGPIGLVVLAIAALIAAGVLLVQNWEWVQAKVTGAVGLMTQFVDSRFAYLALLFGPVGAIVMVFKFRDQFVAAFEWIQEKVGIVIDWIGGKIDWIAGKLEILGTIVGALGGAVSDPLGTAGRLLDGGVGLLGFDNGGVVPGPVGSPRVVLAHGGETILPTHKGPVGAGNTYNITVHALDGRGAADAVLAALRMLGDQGALGRGVLAP